jgi:hypothetical protein
MTATRWEAPRIGYLLTSALAGRRYDEASAMWRELDKSAQCDVITALAAQSRLAVQEADAALQIDFTRLADTNCADAEVARAAAETVYQGTAPWQRPQCPDCRELVAAALAEIQLQAAVADGMPPPYVDLICRGKAVGGAA